MKEFHFSCGNSSDGPIGFCAVIRAETKEEALATLREQLPEDVPADRGTPDSVVYIRVYFNEMAVTENDIDIVEED